MTVRSAGARVRQDGQPEFPGEMTVAHVTREEDPPVWNDANDSPSYTEPEASRATRKVTFVLATPRAEFLAPCLQNHSELVLSATIDSSAVPELPGIVLDSDWPTVAEDEHCQPVNPWINVRDFNGWDCTEEAISVTPRFQPAQTTGQDHSGLRRYSAPIQGLVTILLHLRFAPPAPATPAPPGR
jgi:hypothetical protein